MGNNVQIVGDVRIAIDRMHEKAEKALRKIGMAVESAAKDRAPVQTGLLRNSITYAIGGQAPAAGTYAANDGSNEGHYNGEADTDEDGEMSVIIGTGVDYAPYQELGHHTKTGKWVKPQPFLRPAMEGSMEQIKQILETELKPD